MEPGAISIQVRWFTTTPWSQRRATRMTRQNLSIIQMPSPNTRWRFLATMRASMPGSPFYSIAPSRPRIGRCMRKRLTWPDTGAATTAAMNRSGRRDGPNNRNWESLTRYGGARPQRKIGTRFKIRLLNPVAWRSTPRKSIASIRASAASWQRSRRATCSTTRSFFFLQDNGACAEMMGRGTNFTARAEAPTLPPMKDDDPQFGSVPKQTRDGWPVRQGYGVMPGGPDTYIAYGRGWANVSNTPFRECQALGARRRHQHAAHRALACGNSRSPPWQARVAARPLGRHYGYLCGFGWRSVPPRKGWSSDQADGGRQFASGFRRPVS